jgi:hypothetical protein
MLALNRRAMPFKMLVVRNLSISSTCRPCNDVLMPVCSQEAAQIVRAGQHNPFDRTEYLQLTTDVCDVNDFVVYNAFCLIKPMHVRVASTVKSTIRHKTILTHLE